MEKLILKYFNINSLNNFLIYKNIFIFNRKSQVKLNFYNISNNFIKNKFYFHWFNYVLFKIFIIIFYCNNFFIKFIYIISAGLGFKKRKRKFKRGRRVLDLYIGNRHRLAYNMPTKSFIFIFKRSNIILFSNSKNNLYYPINSYRNFRKELVFKIKGFYLNRYKIKKRIARVWAFARRIKFKKIKLKLSKKQKFV